MFQLLASSIKNFGVFYGFNIWIHLKVLKSNTINLPGYSSKIHLRNNGTDIKTFREIFLRNAYRLKEQLSDVNVIIDAGANIGFTSRYFARKFPSAAIYSLEPDEGNFEILRKNTEHHNTIIPIRTALWNKVGNIIVRDKGYGVRGFIVEDVFGKEPESLPATTIQELIKKYNITRIDILKVDIEGSEKEVFSADHSWLAITRCLIIELHDRMKEGCSHAVMKALLDYNFEMEIMGENLLFINKDIPAS